MGNNSFLSSTKLQMFLLFLVGGFLMILSWIFWGMPTAGLSQTDQAGRNQELTPVNYVMAKIQAAMSLFSLEGREINRKYLSLDDQGLNSTTSGRATNSNSRSRTQENSNLTAAKDVKAKPSTKTSATASKSQIKPVGAVKPSRDIEAERKKRLAEWDEYNQKMKDYQDKKLRTQAKKDQVPDQLIRNNQFNYNSQLPSTTSTTEENKKAKKSIEEWKQELAAAQSLDAARAVIVKFVAAYKNKEIDEIEFYMVVQTYLKSSDENQKGLGLYALRGAPSYASYLLLVKQQSEFSPTFQKYIQDTLLSYHHGGLGTLQQALASKDTQVITKTLDILKTGLTNIKNGSNDGLVDPRYRRDSDFITFNVKNYLSFSKILEQLSQTGEGTIKTNAQELAALINSSQATNQPVVASTP